VRDNRSGAGGCPRGGLEEACRRNGDCAAVGTGLPLSSGRTVCGLAGGESVGKARSRAGERVRRHPRSRVTGAFPAQGRPISGATAAELPGRNALHRNVRSKAERANHSVLIGASEVQLHADDAYNTAKVLLGQRPEAPDKPKFAGSACGGGFPAFWRHDLGRALVKGRFYKSTRCL